jgi:hypothetical protein
VQVVRALFSIILPNQDFLALALLIVTLPWILKSGGVSGKACAKAVLLMLALALAASLLGLTGAGRHGFMPVKAAADFMGLVLLVRISLQTDRLFPLVMAAAALIAVTTHALRYSGLLAMQASYLMLVEGSTLVTVLALWIGVRGQVAGKADRVIAPPPGIG